ncbi:Hypothetical predicted protein [Pelobates cultripes]|uniref:Uncharacterized protein n=1 Tax=Pelobates cultripes TaxID=61616 RepID=A0AAD1WCN4_PELCU|nr:Hypothetical predicted protein [Pelobates cultripes]
MAPASDGPSCSSSETSLNDLRELETLARSKQVGTPTNSNSGAPVTETALKALLDELRRNIATDISAFRDKINGVSACLHNAEVTTAGYETRLTILEWELTVLRSEQAKAQHCMATMEDRRRWKNIKVRGLPDTVTTAEITHLIRRLLAQLFPAKQAKQMMLDSCNRLPVPPATATGVHRDVIIRFQAGPDKQALMAATHNKSPYTFEDHQLMFYTDLSRAILDWRRTLRLLTAALTKSKVAFGGTPKSLLIPQDSGTLKVFEDTEIPGILQKLEIPATTEGPQTSALDTQPRTWDPSRVRLFVPATLRGDPATTAVS